MKKQFFPVPLQPETHTKLQQWLCSSWLICHLFIMVTHDKKPTPDKLLTYWTSWPNGFSLAAVFGILFKMKDQS